MSRPQVLLVAVGGYGAKYLTEMTTRDTGADIAGIVEVMPDIAEKQPVIQEKDLPVYASIADFYREHTADLAVISAPIQLHTAMTVECLGHGSHVLCEKPLCLTEEEAHTMAAEAEKAGRFLAIGYQLNYQRDVLQLKRDILSGRFGRFLRGRVVHAMRRGAKYYARNNWAGMASVNGREVLDSPFNNACAHNFQLMTFLLGKDMASAAPVTLKDGELYRANSRITNYDIAALRFVTEQEAPVLYYTAHPLRTKNLGPSGRMEFEHAVVTWELGQRYRAELDNGEVIDYGTIPATPLLQKLYDAIDCVQHGGVPSCAVEAEYPHIRAVRSVQTCPIRPVDPSLIDTVEEDGDTFLCVRGLEEAFLRSADSWALPGELGLRF